MFDGSLPGPVGLAAASDGELIDAITGCAAAAAAAEARKFAALAEWHRRASADPQRGRWACDDLDEAAAQVACALTISHGRALGWMETAVALRDKLPRLNRRFLAGQVSERVVSRIVWQCALVVDEGVWAGLDEQFAAAATGWGTLSGDKLDTAIEVWIHTLDPDAVRRVRAGSRARDFQIGKRDDQTGTTSVYGRVGSVDAAIAAARIAALVAGVCADDPRTLAQKRADAFGAVFAGAHTLTCLCAQPDCAAAQNPDARAASVVVHVVADHSALAAQPDPALHGEHPAPTPTPRCMPSAEPRTETETPGQPSQGPAAPPVVSPAPAPRPALLPALPGTVLPAPLLAELIAHGAKIRHLGGPENLPANPGYRPGTALDEFIRARDLTCRHPGCDRPAVHADLDHTIAWPAGPTHPANVKAYCRLHHLLKTFWDDWHDTQSPDGTVAITTPTGHTYTTTPFSALLFPSWTTRGDPPPRPTPSPTPPRTPGRELKMPLRRHTRAQTKTAYITRQRRLNATQRELDRAAASSITQRAASREAVDWLGQTANRTTDYGDDPPPF
ncbi:MAG: DUF222 domain-containing protein [Actinomycetota bacterium]|nr:DUF222 domain-containing protein [Actinomycetota bacterium]